MKLHIASIDPDRCGSDRMIAVLSFDSTAAEVAELEGYRSLPLPDAEAPRYLAPTPVDVPGARPIAVRGGYDLERRSIALYVASDGETVLTLMAFCPAGARYSPVALVRLPGGLILQFMVEADG